MRNKQNDKWNFMYSLAKEYYIQNGNLLIENNYTVYNHETQYNLGLWIANQRRNYKKSKLSEERINLLNEIEMVWDVFDANWEFMYGLAKEFYKEYKDLLIPNSYTVVKNGITYNLGTWIFTQKNNYKKNNLSGEKIRLLNEIGMIWECFGITFSKRGYKKERKKTDAACAYNKEYNLDHILYSDKYDESIKIYIKWINTFTMLKKYEMDELLKLVRNGDITAKEKIANSYLKYVVNTVAHYFPCEKDFIDYVQDANIYILKQIDLHVASEKFHQCISINLLNHLNHIKQSQSKPYALIPDECVLSFEEKELESAKKMSEKEFFQNIKYILTELEYEIICNTFNYDSSFSTEKLLETFEISRERKRQLKNIALEKIKDYIENYDKLPYYNFNARDFYGLFNGYSRSDINMAKNKLSYKDRAVLYKVHGSDLSKSLAKYVFENNREYNLYKSSLLEIQSILLEQNNEIDLNYVDKDANVSVLIKK